MDTVPYYLVPPAIVSRAVPLASEGVEEIAWRREDALEVIRLARDAQLGILGGDVWMRQGSKWVPTYDTWACDRESNESLEAFAARSCDKASAYLAEYPEGAQGAFVYVLVFADPKGAR